MLGELGVGLGHGLDLLLPGKRAQDRDPWRLLSPGTNDGPEPSASSTSSTTTSGAIAGGMAVTASGGMLRRKVGVSMAGPMTDNTSTPRARHSAHKDSPSIGSNAFDAE